MAKKKVVKKAKSPRKSVSKKNYLNKVLVAKNNFLLFLILFVFSFILYYFSTNVLFVNFFGLISVITGFVSFAFLIVFLALKIASSKSGKKK